MKSISLGFTPCKYMPCKNQEKVINSPNQLLLVQLFKMNYDNDRKKGIRQRLTSSNIDSTNVEFFCFKMIICMVICYLIICR